MRVNKHLILARIDKKLQAEKREKVGSIYIPPQYTYMLFNLQFGEIFKIGNIAKERYPDAEPGDLVLFDHTIEDDTARFVDTDQNNDEYRFIDTTFKNEVKGIVKTNPLKLIPNPQYVFLDTATIPIKNKLAGAISDADGDNIWCDENRMRRKLEELKESMEPLEESLPYVDEDKAQDIINAIDSINKERKAITDFLNSERLCYTRVLNIHPSTSEELKVKEQDVVCVPLNYLYALDFYGYRYLLMDKGYIYGKVTTLASV